MGPLKAAKQVREALVRANGLAASWTRSPDGDEFFARYFNDSGYVLASYEHGVVVLARRSKDLVRAAEEIATSVAARGSDWELGPVGNRNRPASSVPDPRRRAA